MPNQATTAPLHARATMTFLANRTVKPSYVASRGGGDQTEHLGQYRDHEVSIEDGRAQGENFTLDREGFALVAQQTAVSDFYEDEQVAQIYDREVEDLIKRETGARRVVVFDHTRRSDSIATQAAKTIREPAWFVHNDYTEGSARRRVSDLLGDEAEDLLSRRFAIINVWRTIAGTVESSPMALCDARTIKSEDLVAAERRAKERVGEIQQALYNPAQRWICFPPHDPGRSAPHQGLRRGARRPGARHHPFRLHRPDDSRGRTAARIDRNPHFRLLLNGGFGSFERSVGPPFSTSRKGVRHRPHLIKQFSFPYRGKPYSRPGFCFGGDSFVRFTDS